LLLLDLSHAAAGEDTMDTNMGVNKINQAAKEKETMNQKQMTIVSNEGTL
jgi:hypothetical protein